MSELERKLEGVLLEYHQVGESHHHLILISPQEGKFSCLHRKSSKNPKGPDLYQQLELELKQSRKNNSYFLQDYHLLNEHRSLAKNYEKLLAAHYLGKFITLNYLEGHPCPQTYEALLKALQAWVRARATQTILLKALFVLARSEGHPIQQDWLKHLDPAKQQKASALLNQAIRDEDEDSENVAELLESLQKWLQHQAGFRMPELQKPK